MEGKTISDYFINEQIRDKEVRVIGEDCFDKFVTRFFTRTKCINYLQKSFDEYFHKRTQLINWNKNTWFDIFDDKNLVEALVWYMQEFNLAKEKEAEEEANNPKKKRL